VRVLACACLRVNLVDVVCTLNILYYNIYIHIYIYPSVLSLPATTDVSSSSPLHTRYTYVRTYVRVCTYVCVYVSGVFLPMCVCVSSSLHTRNTYVRTYVRMCACVFVCVLFACVRVCVRVCVCACERMHACIYIQLYLASSSYPIYLYYIYYILT
jgi:hypothetical protein